MDLSDTIAPTSDQLDAVDLLAGPRTFTIDHVTGGNSEQPVNVHLVEFPRPWRPGKSMRRVLVACWGADGAVYAGRRVRLYCDPSVIFGKEKVGGTRIAALSHIDGPRSVPLLISRGKSAIFVVEPLGDEPVRTRPTVEQVAACTDTAELRTLWHAANPAVRVLIEARVAELNAEPAADGAMFPADGAA